MTDTVNPYPFSNLTSKQRAERARLNRELGNPGGQNRPINPTNPGTHPSGKKFKRDFSLRMDNLSNQPKPPTEEELQRYKEWLELRRRGFHKPATIRAQYTWKGGEIFPKKYRISLVAKEGLYKLARRHGYGHDLSDAKQAHISKFIRALANPLIIWEDTRGDDLKETDHDRLSAGKTKLWCTKEQRLPRVPLRFFMAESTINALYKLACAHATFLTPNPTAAAVLRKGTMIANLLECIGQGWLTPTAMPMRPDQPRFYRYRKPFKDVLNW